MINWQNCDPENDIIIDLIERVKYFRTVPCQKNTFEIV